LIYGNQSFPNQPVITGTAGSTEPLRALGATLRPS
jgi:hypothetical protein